MERFLPIYARKRNLSPKTYDSYRQNLETHIYPYFGDWVMSAISSSAIDGFIDYLFQKPCRGSKSYGKTCFRDSNSELWNCKKVL